MAPPYHGSCICGEVNFLLTSGPIRVTCCHCKNCKKFTGTVFTTSVVFPTESIAITKGASAVHTFDDPDQDSGNVLQRFSCKKCRTPLYSANLTQGVKGPTVAVSYSAIDDFDKTEEGKEVPPEVEYYMKDRVAWVPPVAGAVQAKTKPGRDD